MLASRNAVAAVQNSSSYQTSATITAVPSCRLYLVPPSAAAEAPDCLPLPVPADREQAEILPALVANECLIQPATRQQQQYHTGVNDLGCF
jgi:hypothetical protein